MIYVSQVRDIFLPVMLNADVPVERTIQFKFILKQSTGDIIWQPGPDWVFKAWTTTKTVIVVEEWENSELQKIVEGGVPGYYVAENNTFLNDSTLKDAKIVASAVNEGIAGKESEYQYNGGI